MLVMKWASQEWTTKKISEICSKITTKTSERHQRRRCGVFIVNFEPISNTALLPLFTLNK